MSEDGMRQVIEHLFFYADGFGRQYHIRSYVYDLENQARIS